MPRSHDHRSSLVAKCLFLVFAAVSVLPTAAVNAPERASPNQDKEAALKVAAVNGDIEATEALFDKYFLSCEGNNRDGEFWMRLGAEQGDCRMLANYMYYVRDRLGDKEAAAKWKTRFKELACDRVSPDE